MERAPCVRFHLRLPRPPGSWSSSSQGLVRGLLEWMFRAEPWSRGLSIAEVMENNVTITLIRAVERIAASTEPEYLQPCMSQLQVSLSWGWFCCLPNTRCLIPNHLAQGT